MSATAPATGVALVHVTRTFSCPSVSVATTPVRKVVCEMTLNGEKGKAAGPADAIGRAVASEVVAKLGARET